MSLNCTDLSVSSMCLPISCLFDDVSASVRVAVSLNAVNLHVLSGEGRAYFMARLVSVHTPDTQSRLKLS